MGITSIEWTDRSKNPIRLRNIATKDTGHYCEKISSGCANCYASRYQVRRHLPSFGGVRKLPILPVLTERYTVQIDDKLELYFDMACLREVLSRKTPTKWFWCDMTDMFGSWVPFEWIDRIFAVMALTPHHTHQVLTKRPERMAEYAALRGFDGRKSSDANPIRNAINKYFGGMGNHRGALSLPLDNAWLGCSCENQQAADERIPHLLECAAVVRFISYEPALGPLNLEKYLYTTCRDCGGIGVVGSDGSACNCAKYSRHVGLERQNKLHWVIAGGESGPDARPCKIEWLRDTVRQCKAAGVPCFVKQDSGPKPGMQGRIPDELWIKEFPNVV